jgi:EAL and modified HD-GYP domain-containing signal transduction protein
LPAKCEGVKHNKKKFPRFVNFLEKTADNPNMDAFVARQAIFDRNKNVYGYELLFRSCQDNFFDHSDESSATSQVISNSLLTIGLDRLLSGRRAFINFGRNLLVQELTPILPRELIVVEVLETVRADSAVLEACRDLKRRGYLIALDDFVCDGCSGPLSPYADILKVDFRATPRDRQVRMVAKYSKLGIKMLAEKLESYEEYQWAREAGYDYFQGYFFARPTVLRVKQIPSYKINALRLLRALQKPELDYAQLESLIKQDVSFSYKLLRYVNSAAFHFRNPIGSIKQALVILGDDEIRRWTTLVALPGMAQDKPGEVVTHALVRARFCELLGKAAAPPGSYGDTFLIGMFSLLDAMIDRPLLEIVRELNLHQDMQEALIQTHKCKSNLAAILRLVLGYEAGCWAEVENEARRLRISNSDVATYYLESLDWMDALLSTLTPAPDHAATLSSSVSPN